MKLTQEQLDTALDAAYRAGFAALVADNPDVALDLSYSNEVDYFIMTVDGAGTDPASPGRNPEMRYNWEKNFETLRRALQPFMHRDNDMMVRYFPRKTSATIAECCSSVGVSASRR